MRKSPIVIAGRTAPGDRIPGSRTAAASAASRPACSAMCGPESRKRPAAFNPVAPVAVLIVPFKVAFAIGKPLSDLPKRASLHLWTHSF